MNFIQEILPERIIDALGWTILHSLWQGFVIGSLLLLLLFFYRYQSSNLKYNLSVFSLVLICGLFFLTFIINCGVTERTSLIVSHRIRIASYINNEVNPSSVYSGIKQISPTVSVGSITEIISGTFPFMISFWFVGVIIITVRMTGGFYVTQRLRNSCLYTLPEDIQKRFLKLMGLMKIDKLVTIYESTLTNIPVVIGYFKPLILLPFSAVSNIPCDQIEAIMAHELAHIRRNDYLVNIFQSITETLFFYHPVIWIINHRIRKERENCCDDLAVLYSEGRLTYVKALSSIHDIPVKNGFPLLAMASKKYYLLQRVLRILKQGKMKTNLRDKLLAGIVLLSAIIIILLNTGGSLLSFNSTPVNLAYEDHLKGNQGEMISAPLIDSLAENLIATDHYLKTNKNLTETNLVMPFKPDKPTSISMPEPLQNNVPIPDVLDLACPDTSLKVKDNIVHRTFIKDGREMNIKMKIEKGEVKELYVNGEKIPEEDYDQYQAEIDKTLEDLCKLQEELAEAQENLKDLDMEGIRKEIEESMIEVKERMEEIDIEAMIPDIKEIEVPEIDDEKIRIEIENAITKIEDIDMEKIHAEIEKAMDSVCIAIENIELPDIEKIKIEMESAIKEIAEIDGEKIRAEIEKSISEIKIDQEAIKTEIEKAMKEMEEIDIKVKIDLEKEKAKMEEMLKELEKLEINKK